MSDIGVYLFTTELEPIVRRNLPAVPSEGDEITVDNGHYRVRTVIWELDAADPSVQLQCEVIHDE